MIDDGSRCMLFIFDLYENARNSLLHTRLGVVVCLFRKTRNVYMKSGSLSSKTRVASDSVFSNSLIYIRLITMVNLAIITFYLLKPACQLSYILVNNWAILAPGEFP